MQVEDVDGIPTHVFRLRRAEGGEKMEERLRATSGDDGEGSLAAAAAPPSLLMVVPGSPGMAHFYVPFARRVFQQMQRQSDESDDHHHNGDGMALGPGYEVCVVSHAGHSPGVIRPGAGPATSSSTHAQLSSASNDGMCSSSTSSGACDGRLGDEGKEEEDLRADLPPVDPALSLLMAEALSLSVQHNNQPETERLSNDVNIDNTDAADADSSCPDRDWYNLREQVEHKLAYLREHAHVCTDPESPRTGVCQHRRMRTIYLLGHSIGCYVILKMLEELESSGSDSDRHLYRKIAKVFFIYPVLEWMAETPKGRMLHPFFSTLRAPATFLVWLLSLLPQGLKEFLLGTLVFRSVPKPHLEHVTRAVTNIDSRSIHNILSMAEEELRVVREPPLSVIAKHIRKLEMYYKEGDKWTLDSSYRRMADSFPNAAESISMCRLEGVIHSFVIESSDEMADFVCSRLRRVHVNN